MVQGIERTERTKETKKDDDGARVGIDQVMIDGWEEIGSERHAIPIRSVRQMKKIQGKPPKI